MTLSERLEQYLHRKKAESNMPIPYEEHWCASCNGWRSKCGHLFQSPPMMCAHANEVPNLCPCEPSCYCKTHTCKPNILNEQMEKAGKILWCPACGKPAKECGHKDIVYWIKKASNGSIQAGIVSSLDIPLEQKSREQLIEFIQVKAQKIEQLMIRKTLTEKQVKTVQDLNAKVQKARVLLTQIDSLQQASSNLNNPKNDVEDIASITQVKMFTPSGRSNHKDPPKPRSVKVRKVVLKDE